jgi:predicted secreted protein
MAINSIFMSKTIIIILIIMASFECTKDKVTSSNEQIMDHNVEGQLFNLPVESISTKVGSTFTIKVSGNPSTGFGWYLKNKEELTNSQVLEASNLNQYGSGEFESYPHEEGMVGVGGNYYFKFKAKAAGNVQLIFEHKRPWEKEVLTTYTVKVVVN